MLSYEDDRRRSCVAPAEIGTPRATSTVFVVDDDESARGMLESVIRCAGFRSEVFGSAEAFFAHPQPNVPKCLLLDVSLPGIGGLDLQNRINAERPDLPIIFLAAHADVSMTVRAMRAGAFDFFIKPFSENQLLEAIRSAVERSQKMLFEVAALKALRDRYSLLTNREREVMDLVAAGLLNKQIGTELGISEITVKAHRGSLMRKMAAVSLPALVRFHAKLFAA
jgi:FixJ family two-component response regulator